MYPLSNYNKMGSADFDKLYKHPKGKKALAICPRFDYNPHEKKIFKLRYRETGKIAHRGRVRETASADLCVLPGTGKAFFLARLWRRRDLRETESPDHGLSCPEAGADAHLP